MILFLDTDILLDLALDRKPFSLEAESVFDFIQHKRIKTFVSWHGIANFYYLMQGEKNDSLAKEFIKDLLSFSKIAKTSNDELLLAMKLKMKDFEDAMQVVAALTARADYIITRNVKDFKNSSIKALSAGDFLKLQKV